MAFVTAFYHGGTPLVQTGVFYRTVEGPIELSDNTTVKYRATLEDGTTWLIYATPAAPDYSAPVFVLTSNTQLSGPAGWRGSISVAKIPTDSSSSSSAADDEDVYDSGAGAYPVGVEVFGSVNGSAATGTYGFRFTRGGSGKHDDNDGSNSDGKKALLMFALPHHVASFDERTATGRTGIRLATVTKGYAVAYRGDTWTMTERLPVDMGFAPYAADRGSVTKLSAEAACAVVDAAAAELEQDVDMQTRLDSMYFSGKALAKFASVVYAANDLGGNAELAAQGLKKLKAAFAVFVDNNQPNPLVYDEIWGGVVSSAGYADANADFGNAYYNDHHFHYGYL